MPDVSSSLSSENIGKVTEPCPSNEEQTEKLLTSEKQCPNKTPMGLRGGKLM